MFYIPLSSAKKKIISTSMLMLATAIMSFAGEFWILPAKFKLQLNDVMPVVFLEGENFVGEAWPLSKHKIEKLELHNAKGTRDILKEAAPADKVKLNVTMTQEGTQLLALQSDYTSRQTDPKVFNEYLKKNGLDAALKQRTDAGELNKPVREVFNRNCKLVIQVGAKTDDTFKKKTGFQVEIVPLQNPYVLKTGDYLDCLVLLEGKVLPHQLIKVWNSIGRTSFQQDIYTENDGTIRFPISAAGKWMITTVVMIPSEKPNADWQSMYSSLIFRI